MRVRIIKPFSIEKSLGHAYNDEMARIPDADYACLCDLDTCFLTPDAGNILHTYAEMFPEAGLFTCFTNRIHPLAPDQILGGTVCEDTDFKKQVILAEKQKEQLYTVTEINHVISGFLMMIPKKIWHQVKFVENGRCLGVDNDFSHKVLSIGKKIYRMNGLLVWHTYRMLNGLTDKTHLKNDSVHGGIR
jgi:GT2 family glycosyltransferase